MNKHLFPSNRRLWYGLPFTRFFAPVKTWFTSGSSSASGASSNLIRFQISPDAGVSTDGDAVDGTNHGEEFDGRSSANGNPPAESAWKRYSEIFFLFLLFALFAGQLPPDVNESHYLTKAKHFWDPLWCPEDLFLGSAFSHWLFYWLFGWISRFVSLETFAWTGRILTWALLAGGWLRLSRSLVPRFGYATFSAAMFLLLNEQFHLAGEWVVGGFEAKGFAYAFVLFALAEMVRGNNTMIWPLAGLAAAFHVLVGGWAIACFLLCEAVRCFFAPPRPANESRTRTIDRTLCIAAGILFLLVGAIPPLIADLSQDQQVSLAASRIYVHSRISHHLLFGSFPTINVARFVMLTLVWLITAGMLLRFRPIRMLQLFCAGSILISLAGLMLSGFAEELDGGILTDFCCRLLRFYWFRLSDFAVPAAFSISTAVVLFHWQHGSAATTRTRTVSVLIVALITLAAGLLVVEKQRDPRPRADRRSLPDYPDKRKRTMETYENWKKVCQWVSENTPEDAVFITPARQQTFKWYAGRTEVACWKDIPQDAESILEWNNRLANVYTPQIRFERGLFALEDKYLLQLAAGYDVDYILVPQIDLYRIQLGPSLKQVYPKDGTKATYVVLRVEPSASVEEPSVGEPGR